MKLIDVNLNYPDIEKAAESLENQTLKEYALYFSKGYENIMSIYALPLAIMNNGFGAMQSLENRLRAAAENKFDLHLKSPASKELFKKYQDDSRAKVSKKSITQLKKFNKEVPFIRNAADLLVLNTMVNAWTYFETLSKDVWVYLLNSHPKKFINSALEHSSNEPSHGIDHKNISIKLLAKYDFQIDKVLGDIINTKYDFTSVRGINKAYKAIESSDSDKIELLQDSELNQLEITRHLLVHKAGVIDDEYLKRSMYSREKIGTNLELSSKRISNQINSSIDAGIEILQLADNILKDGG